MNLPRYTRVLLAIGSGAALGLAFPNYNFYLLAWVAMGPAACLLMLEQRFGYSLELGSPFFTINAWVGVAVSFGVLVGVTF